MNRWRVPAAHGRGLSRNRRRPHDRARRRPAPPRCRAHTTPAPGRTNRHARCRGDTAAHAGARRSSQANMRCFPLERPICGPQRQSGAAATRRAARTDHDVRRPPPRRNPRGRWRRRAVGGRTPVDRWAPVPTVLAAAGAADCSRCRRARADRPCATREDTGQNAKKARLDRHPGPTPCRQSARKTCNRKYYCDHIGNELLQFIRMASLLPVLIIHWPAL